MITGTAIRQQITFKTSFIKNSLRINIFCSIIRKEVCFLSPEVKKITVICASVCKPDTPGWWVLEPYSFWLRRTWAVDYTGHGHTSIWHFENPNHDRRPRIHKYSKYSASIEIPVSVFFVSYKIISQRQSYLFFFSQFL